MSVSTLDQASKPTSSAIPIVVAAPTLLTLTLVVMGIGIFVPFSPLGEAVGMVPLPLAYFPWLAATLLCYCVLTQLVKRWYIRRYGMWL